MSKTTVSERRLAANRANAAKSTGPRTPEGKAASARNSLKHGFAVAAYTVVRLEDVEETNSLRENLMATHQPVNARERFALERMAIAQQTLLRVARLEAGLFTCCLNQALSHDGIPFVAMGEDMIGDLEITRAQNRNYAMALGFQHLARSNAFTLFLRYQAQAERNYRRAVEEFESLRAQRSQDLPNEPNETALAETGPESTERADVEPEPGAGGITPAPQPQAPVRAAEDHHRVPSPLAQPTSPLSTVVTFNHPESSS